ncbi:hypothetical protein INT43_009087 [Umbelopsis isabellina]|uniref:Uncharacterized protein n=1 Tax=Mortierella isabellina TaxID=91625 RepID=A0A8H7U6N2_MORIS|nr:hypothetical protein INT43_009087 [Umbelopsis isabellina]
MAPRRDQEESIGLMNHDNLIDDDEEVIEFANYAESDDDDEDPYFMPEHTKKSHTLSFSSLTCSPIQLIRFTVPAVCVTIIVVYTIVVGVLTSQRKHIPSSLDPTEPLF